MGVAVRAEKISVVMPVRNAGPFLEHSLRSILAQSHERFEFVIRDDASEDGSTGILREWAARDRRIRLLFGDRSLGPAGSSNSVVRQSICPIVARMDADDISRPDRLQRQLELLLAEPDCVLVGSLWEGIDSRGRRVRPRDRSALSGRSPFAPFPHGSIMFRRDAFEQAGGYRPECDFWEDADLYIRLASLGRLLVLPEPLYLHRASPLSTRLTSRAEEVERSVDRMYRSLGRGQAVSSTAAGAAAPAAGVPAKVLPRVFVSLGSTRLWTGERTGVLARLWRRASLRFDRETVMVLGWALWGAVSPRTLRFVLSSVIRVRDFAVRGAYPDSRPCRWRPPAVTGASPPLASKSSPAVAAAEPRASRTGQGGDAGHSWGHSEIAVRRNDG